MRCWARRGIPKNGRFHVFVAPPQHGLLAGPIEGLWEGWKQIKLIAMIFNTGGGRTAGIGAVSILQQVLDYRGISITAILTILGSGIFIIKFEYWDFNYWDIFSVPIHPDNRGLAVYLCSDYYYYYCRDQPTTTYILLAALFIVMVSALNPCKHV